MARKNGQKGFGSLIAKDIRNVTFAVLLFLSLAVGGTLAFISTTSETAANAFAASSTPIPVLYENDSPLEDGTHENTIPLRDGVANKVVEVKNEGASGFVRVRITLPQLANADGSYVAYDMGGVDASGFVVPVVNDTITPPQYESVVGDCVLVFGADYADAWAYRDGWFYYRGVLAHDAKTEPLLRAVRCSDSSATKVEVGVIVEALYNDADSANTTWNLTTGSGKFAADGSWDAS